MSIIVTPDVEASPSRNLNLLSLGQYTPVHPNNGRIVNGIVDAGGPQGISQIMILRSVMDSIARNSGDTSGMTVKRPCEVFHAIGGVGTGG